MNQTGTCTKCGIRLGPGSAFCPACGTRAPQPQAAVPPQQPPPSASQPPPTYQQAPPQYGQPPQSAPVPRVNTALIITVVVVIGLVVFAFTKGQELWDRTDGGRDMARLFNGQNSGAQIGAFNPKRLNEFGGNYAVEVGAVQAAPEDPDALETLAKVYYYDGHYSEAAAVQAEILRLYPDRLWTVVGLGDSLRAQGDIDQALEYYEYAMDLAPDNVAVVGGIGVALTFSGYMDPGIFYLEDALRLSPNDVYLLFSLGEAYLKVGDDVSATFVFDEVLRLSPPNSYFHQMTLAYGKYTKK